MRRVSSFLPELASGRGTSRRLVEGRRTKSAGYAGGPSTIAARWSPSPSKLGEEL